MFSIIVGALIAAISLVLCIISHIKKMGRFSLVTLIFNGLSCLYNIMWMLAVNVFSDKSRFDLKALFTATSISTILLIFSLLICLIEGFHFFLMVKLGLSKDALAPISSDSKNKTLRTATIISVVVVFLLGVLALYLDYFF